VFWFELHKKHHADKTRHTHMHYAKQLYIFRSNCLLFNILAAPSTFQIIFVETICNDQDVLERNIRLKVQQSPDYAEQ
jgi:hypothetical protein